jgi:hypothetical protein
MHILKDGCRAAIVLPDGRLFGKRRRIDDFFSRHLDQIDNVLKNSESTRCWIRPQSCSPDKNRAGSRPGGIKIQGKKEVDDRNALSVMTLHFLPAFLIL